MAAPSPNLSELQAPPRRRKRAVRLASDQDHAAPSPALGRQVLLEAQWLEADRLDTEPHKWSHRKTLAFIALTCGGFWACVILGIARAVH